MLTDELSQILLAEGAPEEFGKQLCLGGVVRVELVAAISSEKDLDELLLKHITWSGEKATHVGNMLCSKLAWETCRKRILRRNARDVAATTTGTPGPVAEADEQTLYNQFKDRNNFLLALDERCSRVTLALIK